MSELLAACPGLTILATSRAPLRLSWEREFAVGPLEVPAADLERRPEELLACPSVELLLERMSGVGLADSGDPEDLAALAGICRRLDGIPLAIELAAARSKLFTPPALLARLERPLELLTGGARDTPARHQALRKTFDWSYELLTETDQRLFRHLGVFVGGCTFEAAAHVSDSRVEDIGFIDALERLVDSGLVSRVDQGVGQEARLLLLEPVREYALEQLHACGEQDVALQRHAIAFLELAERADPEIRGHQQRYWLARLEREHGNSLVALRWFVDNRDVERGLRLASSLGMFWWVRGYTREGFARLNEVLALPTPEHMSPPLATARGNALAMAGALRFWLGDYQVTDQYEHAALALYGESGDPARRAFALITLSNSALGQRELDRAQNMLRQTLELYQAASDQRGIAQATQNMGLVALYQGDHDRAEALLTKGVAGTRAAGDMRAAAFGLRTLVMLHCQREDFEAARMCVRESLAFWRDVHGRVMLPFLLEAAAIVAVGTGDNGRGLRIAGSAAARREELDTPAPPVGMRELTRWLDKARATLGPEASAKAWAEGLALGIEAAVAEALAADVATAEPDRSTPPTAELEALPSGLTRRETQVLRMVASGNTNKEIASQLTVSVATIERHLANIYAKIGARGRAEATAFAITRGLLASPRE